MAKKKKIKTNDAVESKDTDIDFSFQDVENEVDKILGKTSEEDKKKPIIQHISDKIQMGMTIKNNLPDKGFLNVKAETGLVKYKDRYGEEFLEKKVIITSKDIHDVEYVEITDGLFNIDLRNDSEFWFIRSPITVPSMIRQAQRVAIDVKECYKIVKRKFELPILLIVALLGGAAIIILMLWSLLG